MRCPNCKKSTLRKAKYCHNCGASLSNNAKFESTAAVVVTDQAVVSNAPSKMELITTTGLIWGLSLGGCWFADIDPAWSVVPGLVTLIGPTVAEAAYQWVTLPKPPREHITKIQAEHVDELGRPRTIADFDEKISLAQLAWVANRVADGQPFSRRGMCQPGKFSQGDFYAVRDEFFKLHYAFYKNPAVPNEGIILTPRCQKLLKSVVKGVVDGG